MATTTHLSLEERLDRQESRAEIDALGANYCRGCDGRDAKVFMSIWHEDASYDVGGPFSAYQGHEQIRVGLQEIWDALAETHHWPANATVEFEASDRASGRSDVGFELVDNDGRFVVGAASYDDRFERRDGVWKIAHRKVDIHYRRAVSAEMYD